MVITEFYQAFGVCFGSCCLLLDIWHGIRPEPTPPEQPTGFETVKYHTREVETIPVKETPLENTIDLSV